MRAAYDATSRRGRPQPAVLAMPLGYEHTTPFV
jgi:hypothetical protein